MEGYSKFRVTPDGCVYHKDCWDEFDWKGKAFEEYLISDFILQDMVDIGYELGLAANLKGVEDE